MRFDPQLGRQVGKQAAQPVDLGIGVPRLQQHVDQRRDRQVSVHRFLAQPGTQLVGQHDRIDGIGRPHIGCGAQRLERAGRQRGARLGVGLHHLNAGAAGEVGAHRLDRRAQAKARRRRQHRHEHHDGDDPRHRPGKAPAGKQAMARRRRRLAFGAAAHPLLSWGRGG